MATNQTGIAIVIKAWLPTGKTLDEQLASLTLVKQAHETGDYAPLLSAAQIETVQTDSKTRRVEENPTQASQSSEQTGNGEQSSGQQTDGGSTVAGPVDEVPAPIPENAEPAATDDALAERPDMTETDGTVVEPAVEVPEPKASRKKAA